MLGQPVQWEISILNVDKPPLDYVEIQQRLEQIPPEQDVWLTRAATFDEERATFLRSDVRGGRRYVAADRRSA